MFCKNCGTQYGDGEKFCPNCGTPAGTAPAPAPAPAARPAGNLVEKYRSTPLFLAAVICLSVAVLFQLISIFQTSSGLGQISSMMKSLGLGNIMDSVNAIVTLVGLCAVVISGLILAGLWLAYVSGLGNDKAPLLGKGLSLARIGAFSQLIFATVLLSLVALAVLIVTIIGSGAVSDMESHYRTGTGYGGTLGAIGIVLFLLIVGIGVLMFFYYRKAHHAVRDAEKVVTAGAAPVAPSMFLIVMTFILAGFSLLSLLTSGFGDAVTALNMLATIGAQALFAIVAVQYRKEITG